ALLRGLQAQDLQAAEQGFKEALGRDPGLVLAHVGLAQVALARGDEDQAYSQYREILKREPDHGWAKPRFEALREKRTEEFTAEARRAIAAGDPEAGKRAYLKALFYSPESVEANLDLARIYRKEKNTQSAALHYRAASAAAPNDRTILKEYAETLSEAEQDGRSLDVYELLAQADPKDKAVRDRIESLKNSLGIYEIPSLYNDIPASDAISREELAALVAVKLKGVRDGGEAPPTILVDIATSWASRFILKVTALGVMESYENHTFQPRKIINRAELAETLVRLVNFLKNKGYKFAPQMPPDRVQISDVPPDNYFRAPIVQIVAYQIMDLGPQRTFRPDAVVGGREAIGALDVILGLMK
ncbi:MAG TPA: tetratricopeptide repeat protein, partial [Acidobacteriota bacterium]|nr:tetratricopeptide repeat protein [Acidobacteriota bacterium]